MILTKKATGTVAVDTMQHVISEDHQTVLTDFLDQLVAQNKTDGIVNQTMVDNILLRDRYFIDQSALDEYLTFCGNWATTYGYDITLTGGDI